jgi:hypothetical protein
LQRHFQDASNDVQADTASVPRSMVESNVRQAFYRRGMSVDSSMDLQAIIEGDIHFVVDHNVHEADNLVRTDMLARLCATACFNSTSSHCWPTCS